MSREKQPQEAPKEIRRQKAPEPQTVQPRPEVEGHTEANLNYQGGTTESQVSALQQVPTVSRRSMVQQISRMQGNRHVQRLVSAWNTPQTPTIQAKLQVSQPGDRDEQEADRVAHQVMTQPETSVQRSAEEEDELKTKPEIQRAGEGAVQAGPDVEKSLAGSKGGGNALPESTRNFMESRFGTDFSGVRVHTDNNSVQMNHELQAQAFTHGQDIYFNQGKYNPENNAGKELLAHELTHVVQQTGGVSAKRLSRQADAQKFGEADPKGQIAALHPAMQAKVRALIENAHKKGLNIQVFQGMRTFAEQDELYAQGRTKKGDIVTNAKGGESYHNYGVAVDVVFHGKSPWGEQHDWNALGKAGQEAGLEWGGSWKKFVDRPHFQIPGLSLSQMQTWYKSGGLSNVWKHVEGSGTGTETTPAKPATPEKPAATTPVTGSQFQDVLAGKKVLREGDRGDAVKELQKMLVTLGYNVGKAGADGDFGANTAAAVKAFQTAHKLAPDAVVGPKTANALSTAYKAHTEKKDTGTPKPEEKPIGTATVVATHLNVRPDPSTNNPALGQLSKGSQVTVLARSGEWLKITYNGKPAFIHSSFVSLETGDKKDGKPATGGELVKKIQAVGKSLGLTVKDSNISLIMSAAGEFSVTDKAQLAYVFATIHHESHWGDWMTEFASGDAYEGRKDLGNTEKGDGRRYKGRGFVQLTGRNNYTQYGKLFKVDLVNKPELATDPALSAKITVHGMVNGKFTGKKLSDYGSGDAYNFVNARAIINGKDRAEDIAKIARAYYQALH